MAAVCAGRLQCRLPIIASAPPSAVLAELCREPRGPQAAQVMGLEAREVSQGMSLGCASSRVFCVCWDPRGGTRTTV